MDEVLVVGIQEDLCRDLCEQLRARSISVYCAADANSGLARISAPPELDVIVTAGAYWDVVSFARSVAPTASVVVVGGEMLRASQLLEAVTEALREHLAREAEASPARRPRR